MLRPCDIENDAFAMLHDLEPTKENHMPRNLWNDADAAGLSGLDLLVYRSNLLGADRSVCNIFGGNTGSKTIETDYRGWQVRTLWVKGSGSDLATMKRKDFAGLRMDDIEALIER